MRPPNATFATSACAQFAQHKSRVGMSLPPCRRRPSSYMSAMRYQLHTSGPDDTQKLAAALSTLRPPQCQPLCLALHGALGAGKTTFVQGLVHALDGGADLRVQSPTFALARTYPSTPKVHHLDLYRLEDETACFDLGLADLLEDEDVFRCVEWPEMAPSALNSLSVVDIFFDDNAEDARTHVVDVRRTAVDLRQKVIDVVVGCGGVAVDD